MNLLSWGQKRLQDSNLLVDFDQEAKLPRGADKVLWHHPASKGKVSLFPEHTEIRPMPAGMSYLSYREANPTTTFGDALILDAFVSTVVKDGQVNATMVKKFLGNFTGQIFFLGTAFEAVYEGRPRMCFAYLNWRTQYPALRYICPADHPINHSVNCCALHVTLPAAA